MKRYLLGICFGVCLAAGLYEFGRIIYYKQEQKAKDTEVIAAELWRQNALMELDAISRKIEHPPAVAGECLGYGEPVRKLIDHIHFVRSHLVSAKLTEETWNEWRLIVLGVKQDAAALDTLILSLRFSEPDSSQRP